MNKRSFVFDTNVFISAILLKGSVSSSQSLDKAFSIGQVVVSKATFSEFTEVPFRKKFNKYFTDDRRLQIIEKLERDTVFVKTTATISVCRDPKDNKFLELALAAKAEYLISGDEDLLVLNPVDSIPVISPSDFLSREL